jgi:organic hydroperoxide reductase OsmC/OhrA
MSLKYPMTFLANAHATSGRQSEWSAMTFVDRGLKCTIPKEFDGPGTGFSPEDFFILALMNCYVATLKVMAANSQLGFGSLDATASLTLDRDEGSSIPWMKCAHLKFLVQGVENEERFRRLMERVSKQCMIINSVKTSVHFEFEIRAL